MVTKLIDEKDCCQMDIYDVVMKLVGPIQPVGETRTDDERFENLKVLCTVTDRLVAAIDDIGYRCKDAHQYSIKRAADRATKFMNDLGIPD